MGLLKKKNDTVDTKNTVNSDSNDAVVVKKKKKNELGKVLDESVWENTNEIFKSNTPCVIERDGKKLYVGLLLDTNEIGGLSVKASRNDEAKGSIIEAIRTGRIATYVHPAMLEDNSFVIIPTADTLENMEEYSLLTSASYILCTITPTGEVMTETENGTDDENDPDLKITFEQIDDVVRQGVVVESLFPTMNDEVPTDEDDVPDFDDMEEDSEEDIFDDVYDNEFENDFEDNFPDDNDVFDDAFDDIDVSNGDMVSDDELEEAFDADDTYNEEPNGIEQSEESYDESESYEEEDFDEYDDITEDDIDDYIVRTFYSDDLGLEISTLPFDAQFMHGNSYLPFNEDRGTGHLNECLANMAKDANVRMERLHNDNLFRMRERYISCMQAICEQITKELDTTDNTTSYGLMRQVIEGTRDKSYEELASVIDEKKAELEQLWEQTLKQIEEQAAIDARQQHIDRYGKSHAMDLVHVEKVEKDEVEKTYEENMRAMQDDRKAEALKRLDIGINATLKELSQIYLRVLKDERKEYIRLQNEMTRFIDDNRKDEKARIKALQEEQRQMKKAEQVRREYTSKIKSMSAEFDMKKTSLQADIDKMAQEHMIQLQTRESEWNARLQDEQQKNTELKQQMDELLDKYAELEDKKEKEYASRIKTLENEKAAVNGTLDEMNHAHKRGNTIMIFLLVASCIACIGVGFIAGNLSIFRDTTKIEQNAIKSSYDQIVNDYNKNSTENSKSVTETEPETTTGNESAENK